VRKREEKLKKKKEQTPKPEVNDDHTVKLMEYVLYEFDMSKTDRNQTEEDDDETSPEFLEEMYNSF
jgi:phage terminase large subunit